MNIYFCVYPPRTVSSQSQLLSNCLMPQETFTFQGKRKIASKYLLRFRHRCHSLPLSVYFDVKESSRQKHSSLYFILLTLSRNSPLEFCPCILQGLKLDKVLLTYVVSSSLLKSILNSSSFRALRYCLQSERGIMQKLVISTSIVIPLLRRLYWKEEDLNLSRIGTFNL